MERKNSKECSVVFLVRCEKFKEICFRGVIFNCCDQGCDPVGTSLEFAAFGSGPDAKYSRASTFLFFLSITMVFAAVRTHFLRKNTRLFFLIELRSLNSCIRIKVNAN